MGVKPTILTAVTVATAGTRVQVQVASQYCTSIYFEAKLGNAGAVFIGDSTVSASKYRAAISAGVGHSINLTGASTRPSDSNGGPEVQLNSLYVDAATSGAIVMVSYIPRIGNA